MWQITFVTSAGPTWPHWWQAHNDCIAFHRLLHYAALVGDQLRVPRRRRLCGLGQHWVPSDKIPTSIHWRGFHTNCLHR